MSIEKDFFDQQIISLRDLSSIHQYLLENASAMDTSSLLRSEYVLIVSAFDNYLHNIVRRKIVDNFFSSQFLSSTLSLPLTDYFAIHSETNINDKKQILDVSLRKLLEKDSFQAPKSVEYALGLIDIKNIWSQVSTTMGDTSSHIKDQLALLVKRRNQIAHEADINPSTSIPRDIDIQTVSDCREFLQKLVSAIDVLIV